MRDIDYMDNLFLHIRVSIYILWPICNSPLSTLSSEGFTYSHLNIFQSWPAMEKVAQSPPDSCCDYIQMITANTGPPSFEEMNKKALEFIENATRNAGDIQTSLLAEILSRNAHVEYLTKHNLQGRTDCESFKKAVPVVSYEDIAPYIKRIADGDTSPILCSQPVSMLLSSGTSKGEPKLIPTTEEEKLVTKPVLRSLVLPVMSEFIPSIQTGKGMYLFFISHDVRAPNGLVAFSSLTSYYKTPRFLDGNPYGPFSNITSPKETILCPDSHQSMYSQLLCGLAHRANVLRVGAVFASALIRGLKFLENNWELLCSDIRSGLPNPTIVTDKAVRDAVTRILSGPDPALAGFIEAECGKGSWQGIIRRLWPNTKFVDAIVTGTMAQYVPILDFYGDGLPLVTTMFICAESAIGINLNPLCDPSEVAFTIIPNLAYFEFLPVGEEELVDLVDVEVGKQYELVVTTKAGLYRYRVGDVLQVVGFKNKAPQFKFLRRHNVSLSVDADKTDEVELHNVVQGAVNNHLSPLGATLIDYTSYVDTTTVPGHYVLFWEIDCRSCDDLISNVSDSVLEDCCLTIEECLNEVYRQCRFFCKSIGPLEIRVVESGTFDKVVDYMVSHGAPIGQFKMPRCMQKASVIQFLNSRVVFKNFSRDCPKLVP